MISLTKGQSVPETDYVVKEDGVYEDFDLVVCINLENNEAAFQAYYIVNSKCKGEE